MQQGQPWDSSSPRRKLTMHGLCVHERNISRVEQWATHLHACAAVHVQVS